MRLYRREASAGLITHLVEPNDPALHRSPLLCAAASDWLDGLTTRMRSCIVCSAWIVDRTYVGALLLSMPDVSKPVSASACGVCSGCWAADLAQDVLERAATVALRRALPGGRFLGAGRS
jgi:hypothetical protein